MTGDKFKILLVDDDEEELCELVADYLGVEGFSVESVHDGASGAEKILSGEFDLAVLDVMLPKMNGFDALRKVREKSDVPVLILTARGDDMERIVGLEIGADDFLPKPFNPRELVARLRAILRRTSKPETSDETASPTERLRVDDVEANTASRLVKVADKEIELTSIEFDLLIQFLKHAGQVFSRANLSRDVLGRKLSPFDRSLDMHVSNLRKKLGVRPDHHERIKTVRSVGYIFTMVNGECIDILHLLFAIHHSPFTIVFQDFSLVLAGDCPHCRGVDLGDGNAPNRSDFESLAKRDWRRS